MPGHCWRWHLRANQPRLANRSAPAALTGLGRVRIAQLSDLHYDDYFSVVPAQRSEMVNGLRPT